MPSSCYSLCGSVPASKLQAQILLFFYLCLSLRSGSNFQKCKIGGRVAIGIIILDVVFFLVFLLTQVKKIVFSSWWGKCTCRGDKDMRAKRYRPIAVGVKGLAPCSGVQRDEKSLCKKKGGGD